MNVDTTLHDTGREGCCYGYAFEITHLLPASLILAQGKTNDQTGMLLLKILREIYQQNREDEHC